MWGNALEFKAVVDKVWNWLQTDMMRFCKVKRRNWATSKVDHRLILTITASSFYHKSISVRIKAQFHLFKLVCLVAAVFPLTVILYPNPHEELMAMLVYTDLTEPTHKSGNKKKKTSDGGGPQPLIKSTPAAPTSYALCEVHVSELFVWLYGSLWHQLYWCMDISVRQMSAGHVCSTDGRVRCLKSQNMAALSRKCIIRSVMTSYWVIIFCIALRNKLFPLTVDFRGQLWMRKNSSPELDCSLCCCWLVNGSLVHLLRTIQYNIFKPSWQKMRTPQGNTHEWLIWHYVIMQFLNKKTSPWKTETRSTGLSKYSMWQSWHWLK